MNLLTTVTAPATLAVRAATNILRATTVKDVLMNYPDGWVTETPGMWLFPEHFGGPGDPVWGSMGPPGSNEYVYGPLRHPGVARATNIVVDPLVSVDWKVYRGTEFKDEDVIPTPTWLLDPQNAERDGRVSGSISDVARFTNFEFFTQFIMAALLLGDGFIYVPFWNEGQPRTPLFLLNPDDVVLKKGRYYTRADDVEIPLDNLVHLRGLGPYVDGRGQGVLRRHAGAFGFADQVRIYGTSTFRTGVPSGYLKVTSPNLTEEAAVDLRAKWMQAHGGDARSIAILNSTTEFHPIMWSPVESDLVEMSKWTLLDTALAFGIEPFMLGVTGDTSTYANIESRIKQNRQTSLVWAKRIEATVGAVLPHGQFLKIDLDSLLRADSKDRAAFYHAALTDGWMTVDEVRAQEHRKPLPKEEQPQAPPQLQAVPSPEPEANENVAE